MKNFLAIILVGTSIGLFQYYIDPTYQTVKDLRAQEADFDEALNNTEKVAEIRDLLLSKYNSFSQSDLDRLTKLLPDNIDNVRLIIEIDKVASRHGMDLKNVESTDFRPKTAAGVVAQGSGTLDDGRGSYYKAAPLSFSVAGSYADFLEFLRDMEKSLRLMDITDITVKPNENLSNYEYGIKLQTYWLKPTL